MTPSRFRKLALSFDGVVEVPHMERAAFRTKRKIFATLGDDRRVNLQVEPEEKRDALLAQFPESVFSLGGWTRLGYVAFDLATIDEGLFAGLVEDAWRDALPRPPKKAVPKKAAPKKAVPKKAAPKKAAPKKAAKKKKT